MSKICRNNNKLITLDCRFSWTTIVTLFYKKLFIFEKVVIFSILILSHL